MKSLFRPAAQPAFASFALLLLRAIAGGAFMVHGWGKIQQPFSWMGSGTPGWLQLLAALSEFGGGLCWILGALMPLASLGILATMAVAAYTHMIVMKDPFVNLKGGLSYELASVFLGVALVFLAVGPGRFSVDAKLCGSGARG